MPKAALTTLGCKVNQFETETMEGLFRQRGYAIVPFDEAADVYVINTCSVTSLGEKKSRQLIRRARRLNERAVIAVTGCYAQVAPEEIRAIEGVRVVLGTKERAGIVDHVERAAREAGVFDGTGDIMHRSARTKASREQSRTLCRHASSRTSHCTPCRIARAPF